MAQQSAVEWLIKKYQDYGRLYYEDMTQAKAMEKQHMIEFAAEVSYGIGVTKEEMIKVAEKYYNKTYNK